MSRGGARPDREDVPDRVDRLDPETLRLVAAYLVARLEHRACDPCTETAWRCFYRACDPLLRKLAHRRCRRCWCVEDRVQELWRVMIDRLRHYDPDRGSFPSWLATVVRHALTDQDRTSHPLGHLDDERERRLPSREVEPMINSERAESRAMIQAAIKELRSGIPETTYRIVQAHWIEGISYEEIADDLGLSVKQVRDRHHRAVGRFRAILARRMGDRSG